MSIKLSYHEVMGALFVLLTVATSCSNDDLATKTETKPTTDNTEVAQVNFVAGHDGTRTSLNYDSGAFYWEDGDRIYIKDDNNTFHSSSNAVSGSKVPYFKFMMPGKYTANEYTVFYPGQNGTDNQVTIKASQTQTEPNSTQHIGTSGDCGTGKAIRQPNGQYTFSLTHSAAFLCFEPTYDHSLISTYVTKIEVTSDKPIAGTYTLNATNGKLTGTGNAKTVTLTTKGTGGNTIGFPMKTKATGCSAGRAFMVIAPGTYKLTVKYYLNDPQTGVSGIVTKYLKSGTYNANDYYDISAALNIRSYKDDYYTWDAKAEYWAGHKDVQPKIINRSNSNYPTSADAKRWFNTAIFPTAASNTAKDCPNVNECMWYCVKGDPHWDNTTPWTVWGHLYTGGMWFKKASVIASDNGKANAAELKASAPNGKDYAHTKHFETPPNNNRIESGAPAKRSKYFFLPAMGSYNDKGTFREFGSIGRYWTSTPYPYNSKVSFSLYFKSNDVVVSNTIERPNGLRLWTSE